MVRSVLLSKLKGFLQVHYEGVAVDVPSLVLTPKLLVHYNCLVILRDAFLRVVIILPSYDVLVVMILPSYDAHRLL